MKGNLPKHLPGILNDVPKEDRPSGDEETNFWRSVAYEMAELLKHASAVENAQVVFTDMRKAGSQYIWEFYVNNLDLSISNTYNWHGQNTSQWIYAGGLLLQNGKVSLHH